MTHTGILAVIAEVAGEDAAELIAVAKGGNENVYIPLPQSLTADHWLVALVGMPRAKAIAGCLGGGKMLIPLGETARAAKRAKVIADALKDGKSGAEAARLAGCHMRTVRRHRNRVEDDSQGNLF